MMSLCGQVVVIVIVRRNVKEYEEEFLSEAAVAYWSCVIQKTGCLQT